MWLTPDDLFGGLRDKIWSIGLTIASYSKFRQIEAVPVDKFTGAAVYNCVAGMFRGKLHKFLENSEIL